VYPKAPGYLVGVFRDTVLQPAKGHLLVTTLGFYTYDPSYPFSAPQLLSQGLSTGLPYTSALDQKRMTLYSWSPTAYMGVGVMLSITDLSHEKRGYSRLVCAEVLQRSLLPEQAQLYFDDRDGNSLVAALITSSANVLVVRIQVSDYSCKAIAQQAPTSQMFGAPGSFNSATQQLALVLKSGSDTQIMTWDTQSGRITFGPRVPPWSHQNTAPPDTLVHGLTWWPI
jgi:hypothetical protein